MIPDHQQAPLIYLIAGEASGDLIGANLMTALTRLNPNVRFTGIGGDAMIQCGLKSLFPMQELSVMGIFEIIPLIFKLLKRIKQTRQHIQMLQPSAVVTIDAPGFNFRVVKNLKGHGIPLFHYVAPSVWAWRPGRAFKVAKLYDCLLTLFAFEPKYFTCHGLETHFIGHPLIEKKIDTINYQKFRHEHAITDDTPIICVLPGSRQREIKTLMPIFVETISNIKKLLPDTMIVVPTLPHLQAQLKQYTDATGIDALFTTDEITKYAAMRSSSAALAASGTVTLELALAQTPMVIAYKINKFTHIVLKLLVKIKYAALPNILANRCIVTECLQNDCHSTILSTELSKLLFEDIVRHNQINHLLNIRSLIQADNKLPSEHAATIILQHCHL